MIIRNGTVEEAVTLARRMPDFSNPYNLNSADTPPPKLDHILIAEKDGVPVGFRAGYRHSPDTFAVWLAGVLPEFRRKGIGGELYRRQKEWLKSQGYRFLRTHVRNSNRVMLRILVDNGYQVVDVVRYDDVKRNKIVFIKNLSPESPIPASALVVGVLRESDPARDRALWDKLRDLTISWLRFKYRGRVIEESSVNAILDRAVEAGHQYCLVLNVGSIVSHAWQLGFVRTLEDWCRARDFFIAGQILQQQESACGISSHALLVNLQRYADLSRPAYGDTGKTPVEISLPAAATGVSIEQSLAPGGKTAMRVPSQPGWSFVSASLAAGIPVERLPAAMTESILNIAPTSAEQAGLLKDTFGMKIASANLETDAFTEGQRKFLTAVQRQVQNSRKGIFVWNFESYDDVVHDAEKQSPISTICTVAAGLKTNWILEARGFNENTRLVYFDYSDQALTFKKLLHSEWNGENYPDFLRYLFTKIQPGEAFYQLWGGFSPENVGWDAVEETWRQEVAKWGGAGVIKDHWRRAQAMNVEYVLCNVLDDPSPLIQRMDNRPNSVIWWSNVFFTFYSNWCYTIEERRAIYNRFLRSVAERSPETLIYGNDYNNIAVTAVPAGQYASVYFQTEDDCLEPRLIRG